MKQASPYPSVVVKAMPLRASGGLPGRWDWLRDMLINELANTGDVKRFTVPNKKEARLLQSSAQNTSSAVKSKYGKQLPKPYKIRTSAQPVDDKTGEYFVYIQVYRS